MTTDYQRSWGFHRHFEKLKLIDYLDNHYIFTHNNTLFKNYQTLLFQFFLGMQM